MFELWILIMRLCLLQINQWILCKKREEKEDQGDIYVPNWDQRTMPVYCWSQADPAFESSKCFQPPLFLSVCCTPIFLLNQIYFRNKFLKGTSNHVNIFRREKTTIPRYKFHASRAGSLITFFNVASRSSTKLRNSRHKKLEFDGSLSST